MGEKALRNASAPCCWEMAIARRLGAAVSSTGQDPHRLLTTECLTCGRAAEGAAPAVSQRLGQCQTEYQEPQVTRARAPHISCIR